MTWLAIIVWLALRTCSQACELNLIVRALDGVQSIEKAGEHATSVSTTALSNKRNQQQCKRTILEMEPVDEPADFGKQAEEKWLPAKRAVCSLHAQRTVAEGQLLQPLQ